MGDADPGLVILNGGKHQIVPRDMSRQPDLRVTCRDIRPQGRGNPLVIPSVV
ncbi:MAG: hypothetical protein Q4G26_06460 [Paracoccus sp. (in: a-proteobacteria)]|nr:hypothetical protein [Paracoccus sp. (in: a-proteobacteria)]